MVSRPVPLRVLFLGTPDFAVPTLQRLIASSHLVVGVVTQPDRPRGRGQSVQPPPVKIVAGANGIPVWQPERIRQPGFLDDMRGLGPDVGVVAAYGKILPVEFLDIPRLGMVNVHASLLPRWRGASPIQHAVMAGDSETGVTIMRMVEALDAGSMYARVRRPIRPEETAVDVERDLAQLGARALVDVLDQLAAGTAEAIPQDDRLATYAPRLTKADGIIDWRLPAPVLHRRVHGLQPWPGALTHLGADLLILRRTRPLEGRASAPPGTVIEAAGDRLSVACGEATSLAVLELQPQGRRTMTAREFLAGRRLPPGTRLGGHPAE